MNKKWMKPILQVLIQGKAEEAVLITCKNGGVAPAGPNNSDTQCHSNESGCGVTCDVNAAS